LRLRDLPDEPASRNSDRRLKLVRYGKAACRGANPS